MTSAQPTKPTTANGWSNPQQGNGGQYHDVALSATQSTKATSPADTPKTTKTTSSENKNKTQEESSHSPADENKKAGGADPPPQNVDSSELAELEHPRSGFVVPPNRKDTRKLFVGGLPSNVTEREFREFFEQFGPVLDSVVMFDRETRRSRGFGFVTFEDEATSHSLIREGINEHGIAFGHVTMRNKVCEVKSAEPKDPNFVKNGTRGNSGHTRSPSNSNSSNNNNNNSNNNDNSINNGNGGGNGSRHQRHNNNYRNKYRGGGENTYNHRNGPSELTNVPTPSMDGTMMGSPHGPPMYAGPWPVTSVGYPYPNQAAPPGAGVMIQPPPGEEITNGSGGDSMVMGMPMPPVTSAGPVPHAGPGYPAGGMYYPPTMGPGGPAYMSTPMYSPYYPHPGGGGGFPDQYPTENAIISPPMPAGTSYPPPPPPLDANGYPIIDPAAAGYGAFPPMMGHVSSHGSAPPPYMVAPPPADVISPNTVTVENTSTNNTAGDKMSNDDSIKTEEKSPAAEVSRREGQKTGQA
mmetsp:Transcript_289/g.419  ORF Transcript_289/g.419 Transcript_289/m.419 type:complete len:522 (-) Transcript_289:201-1766(-)|eukprot:CAMPEP_0195297520 /NCGR_PEP_ID=MMETSP0707-20130614/21673_1 /TAXON_ID=33640 /ORGANISM="Asterionellopsis glacialis, Strain CCMP134" /LENGTH=521 /DNA_ID=CAMNT_0040359355 /DNA_START=669 /DNA_END=2234 /DNA_ORIENTATION=-